MSWKNWPYWLKGGINGGLLYLITTVFFIFAGYLKITSRVNPCLIPPCPISYYLTILNYQFGQIYGIRWIILFFIVFIVIGILIGWIYGKIKKGKRNR